MLTRKDLGKKKSDDDPPKHTDAITDKKGDYIHREVVFKGKDGIPGEIAYSKFGQSQPAKAFNKDEQGDTGNESGYSAFDKFLFIF
jgi:hypothetical protein